MESAQAYRILAELAGTFLLAVIAPGQNFIFVSAQASRSRRAGLGAAAGLGLAATTWMALAAIGLGLLVAQAAWAPLVLRWLAAACQLRFGLRLLLSADPSARIGGSDPASGRMALGRGYLTSLLNPKAAAFYTGVLGQLLPRQAPAALDLAAAAIVCVLACGWYGAVAIGFSTRVVQRGYARIGRQAHRLAGVLLVGLALKLALPA